MCQLVLFVHRVEGGKGILPAPDDGRPDEREGAGRHERDSEAAKPTGVGVPLSPWAIAALRQLAIGLRLGAFGKRWAVVSMGGHWRFLAACSSGGRRVAAGPFVASKERRQPIGEIQEAAELDRSTRGALHSLPLACRSDEETRSWRATGPKGRNRPPYGDATRCPSTRCPKTLTLCDPWRYAPGRRDARWTPKPIARSTKPPATIKLRSRPVNGSWPVG